MDSEGTFACHVMSHVPARGTLALLGSGELAPSMVAVHRALLARLVEPRAVFIDATYGFQENADELSHKAVEYFDASLRTQLAVASCRRAAALTAGQRGRFLELLAWGTYLFAGPGSPSYGLAQLRTAGADGVLRARLIEGATVVLASAAALTAGAFTIPVYEIYKVGEDPRWLTGLDLLAGFGVSAAVVPHYDNREGGTHDTRFCYVGARRLAALEEQLPEGVGILGIDEHTAVVLSGAAGTVEVLGKGRLVIRRHGIEEEIPAPATLSLEELRERLGRASEIAAPRSAERLVATLDEIEGTLVTLGPVEALGRIADLVGSDDEAARVALARLARHLEANGTHDRGELLRPIVETLIDERTAARAERDFARADRLRDALARAGVVLEDTPAGTRWHLAEAVH